MSTTHYHITGSGLQDEVITDLRQACEKYRKAADYQAAQMAACEPMYTYGLQVRMRPCTDPACLPYDKGAEERRRQGELANAPTDEQLERQRLEEQRRRSDTNYLDGGL